MHEFGEERISLESEGEHEDLVCFLIHRRAVVVKQQAKKCPSHWPLRHPDLDLCLLRRLFTSLYYVNPSR